VKNKLLLIISFVILMIILILLLLLIPQVKKFLNPKKLLDNTLELKILKFILINILILLNLLVLVFMKIILLALLLEITILIMNILNLMKLNLVSPNVYVKKIGYFLIIKILHMSFTNGILYKFVKLIIITLWN
jgi:hypothetical protein